jgi:hypothetical protein
LAEEQARRVASKTCVEENRREKASNPPHFSPILNDGFSAGSAFILLEQTLKGQAEY